MKNKDILNSLEGIAKKWAAKGRSNEEVEAVVDYLNTLCYLWMGGDWGLKLKDISGHSDKEGKHQGEGKF